MSRLVVQLTDTHLVMGGETDSEPDAAAYLSETVAFVNAMAPAPDYVVVTGDLADGGTAAEYERFSRIMSTLRFPYLVIPGNHDDRDTLRETLPARTFGDSRAPRIRFVYDEFAVRLIGLDVTRSRPWPGATVDDETLDWLESTLAAAPERPTIVAMHQPPFRTGLHYLDVFGFRGARRLRRIVAAAPCVGRVICGHIHCIKSQQWGGALATSAPSTKPQFVPELFERRVLGLRRELPGFAVHRWDATSGFATTFYRRDARGGYAPGYGERRETTRPSEPSEGRRADCAPTERETCAESDSRL